jgi:sterol 3beta-glucosyltransferase
MDGLSGIVTKPYKGAKEEGFLGFSKGVAKGSLGLITGPGSAMFGLFAYPFLGMYKSIATASLSPAQKQIVLARQVYGSHMARQRERQDHKSLDERKRRLLQRWEEITK